MPVAADVTTEKLMSFPESPRVVYETNPLDEVICQLKFPSILRIDSQPPAAFQDQLRTEYPLLAEDRALPINLPPAIAKVVGGGLAANKVYQFNSSDQVWTVGLARDFVALSTKRYTRWEEFRSRLERVLGALISEYKPSFWVRAGLRYRDVIKRSDFGSPTRPWIELLEPHILGELSDNRVAGAVQQTVRDTVFALGEAGGRVRVLHGLAQSTSGESCYFIDSDFFTEQRLEVNHVFDVLNSYNRQAGRLFRWCITRQLHDALRPRDVN